MGILDDVGNAVKGAIRTLDPIAQADRLINGGHGRGWHSPGSGFLYNNINLGPPGNASMTEGPAGDSEQEQAAREDARRAKYDADKKKLADDLAKQTNEFRSSIPGLQNDFYKQIEGEARRQMAEQERQIRRQANRRGLLYSGMRAGDEARTKAQIASQAAGQKAKISPELRKMAEDMNELATKTAQANFQDDLQITKQTFDRALQDARARMQSFAQLGEMGGRLAGRYFGSQNADSDRYEMQKRNYSMSINPDGSID